jgi:hypothetical protein
MHSKSSIRIVHRPGLKAVFVLSIRFFSWETQSVLLTNPPLKNAEVICLLWFLFFYFLFCSGFYISTTYCCWVYAHRFIETVSYKSGHEVQPR